MEAPAMLSPCYTCRRRHIHCDRSQIPCLKCQKAGLNCLEKRPVRWVQGVAIRGGMRGRSYQDSSISSTPVGDIELRSDLLVPTTKNTFASPLQNVSSGPSSIPLTIPATSIYNLNATTRYYLDYYNDRICQVFIVYDSKHNPFRTLISIALNDGVLLDALLALAARHRANSDQPFRTNGAAMTPDSLDAHRDALRFKHRAIQGLSSALQGQQSYQDSTVASVFLLIFLDLIESGCDRWNYHIEGAKSLITLTPSNDPGRTVQKIRQFITKQIHLIEALGATFVRPQLLSKSRSIEESANLLQDVIEESFLGCPEYILTAVQFFSLQRDIIASGSPSDQAPAHEVASVLHAVKIFDCYAWASTPPTESVTRDVDDLCRLARTYQLGAILYGQRVLDALLHDQTDSEPVVSDLIRVITSLKDGSSLLKCILWPITVAGLECQDASQRHLLMLALEKFWVLTRCLNVINAGNILQAHWQKVDDKKTVATSWIFDIGSSSHDWLLV